MSRSIVANTVIASGGRVVTVGLGIIATGIITRLLGVSLYGQYALLLSVAVMIQAIADFGLYLTLTTVLARTPEQGQQIFSTTITVRVLLLLMVFLPGVIVLRLLPQYQLLAGPFFIIAIGFIAQSISQLCMGVFQWNSTMGRATMGDIIGRVLQVFGLGCVFLWQPPIDLLSTITGVFTLGAIGAFVVHWYTLPQQVKPFQWNITGWQSILRRSWPLGIMLLLNMIYFRIDIIMLSFLQGDVVTGLYGLAYRVIESALFFPAMFGGLLLPVVSNLYSKRALEKVNSLLQQSIWAMAIGAVFVVCVGWVASPFLVTVVAGTEFAEAVPLLRGLLVALAFMFVGNVCGFSLVAFDKQLWLLKLYAILVPINIVLNWWLIPLYGALGAVISTIITEFLSSMIALYITRLVVPFPLQMPTKFTLLLQSYGQKRI